jgi:hypothetical protein
VVVVVIDALEKASALAVLTAGVLPAASVGLLASLVSLVSLVAFVGIAVGAAVCAVGTDVGICVGTAVGDSRVSVTVVRDTTPGKLGAAAKDRMISVTFESTAGGVNSMLVAATPVPGL